MDSNAIGLSQAEISDVLAAAMMLVTFTSRSWTAEASDEEATDTVRNANNARGNVGSFRKKLLANSAAEHDAVKGAIAAAYRTHCKLTTPWSTGKGGPRGLPNAMVMDYLKEMSRHVQLVEEKVEAFLAVYPDRRDAAIRDLGGMGNASQYPTVNEIREKFGIAFDMEPMPGGKGFPGLPPDVAAAFQKRLEEKTAERMKTAIADLWTQVSALLARYANQLRPDGKIYDSTVEEIQALPTRIKAFNVIHDQKLDAISTIIARELSVYDIKAVKTEQVRKWCHQRATAILGMLPQ